MKFSTKNTVYELFHELPSDLRLGVLGNSEIMLKTQKWVGTESSIPYPRKKKLLVVKNYTKIDIKVFRPV